MDIIKKKTIDMLTPESVSILTQQYIYMDGKEVQVGDNHRCAYVNSLSGRSNIAAEPGEIVNAVMAIWGDTPIIVETTETEKETEEMTNE